jgi:hypothetical protein
VSLQVQDEFALGLHVKITVLSCVFIPNSVASGNLRAGWIVSLPTIPVVFPASQDLTALTFNTDTKGTHVMKKLCQLPFPWAQARGKIWVTP